MKMKIYKFRPLVCCDDFNRLNDIITKRKFWCSRFSELNDPMEGIFYSSDSEIISKIYDEKNKYKICSFSGQKAFSKPTMWGHYAGGFKGVAIEVKVEEKDIKKVTYSKELLNISTSSVDIILSTKLPCWKNEYEYRLLKELQEGECECEIGEISAVHFGNPYGDADNHDEIERRSGNLKKYLRFKKHIIGILKEKQIPCFNVYIKEGVVKKGEEIN